MKIKQSEPAEGKLQIPIHVFFYIGHLKIQREDGWKARFMYRIPLVSSFSQAYISWDLSMQKHYYSELKT